MPKPSGAPRPELGTYVIQLTVREIDWPSNGPDSGSSTASILASYARELEQRINDAYHDRLIVESCKIGVPPNPTRGVFG